MNKVLIIYWPEGGNVEIAADKFASILTGSDFKKASISQITLEDLNSYNNWIIGGSTVGSHIWEDADDSNKWHEFFKMVDTVDLSKKVVAFFGLGDQILYPHHFVDGLGIFQEEFEKRNANIVGQWPVEGYDFSDSEGVKDNKFYGLALDIDRQEDLTDSRIEKWLELIGKDFS